MSEFKLGKIAETPDGEGDVISVNENTIEVSLNDGVPENAEKKTARHAGVYKKNACQ